MSDLPPDPPDHFDSLDITPEVSLACAIRRVRKDQNFGKSLVILLDNNDEKYSTAWYNAGMCNSEIIALLEIVKHRLIRDFDPPVP